MFEQTKKTYFFQIKQNLFSDKFTNTHDFNAYSYYTFNNKIKIYIYITNIFT